MLKKLNLMFRTDAVSKLGESGGSKEWPSEESGIRLVRSTSLYLIGESHQYAGSSLKRSQSAVSVNSSIYNIKAEDRLWMFSRTQDCLEYLHDLIVLRRQYRPASEPSKSKVRTNPPSALVTNNTRRTPPRKHISKASIPDPINTQFTYPSSLRKSKTQLQKKLPYKSVDELRPTCTAESTESLLGASKPQRTPAHSSLTSALILQSQDGTDILVSSVVADLRAREAVRVGGPTDKGACEPATLMGGLGTRSLALEDAPACPAVLLGMRRAPRVRDLLEKVWTVGEPEHRRGVGKTKDECNQAPAPTVAETLAYFDSVIAMFDQGNKPKLHPPDGMHLDMDFIIATSTSEHSLHSNWILKSPRRYSIDLAHLTKVEDLYRRYSDGMRMSFKRLERHPMYLPKLVESPIHTMRFKPKAHTEDDEL
ncbi:uncharacterized protein C13orf42 [Narcine bancroftii]|uniref:uncharacterized protein C13orf42 n=1 Tax=Narcine bancroftii TaxID=1343680 RepID=UPI00383141E0